LPSLCFHGNDPDGEHEVEIRRMYVLLHPDCFEWVLAALRLDAPANRLEVPEFQSRNDKPPEPPSGGQPPPAQLSEENMKNLKESIIQERERRRRFSPAWLRIVVDREERARWPLNQSRSGQIEIASDDRLVEIYGVRGGENVRLAAHMLSYDLYDHLRPVAAKLTLEGGQELRLAIEPLRSASETANEGELDEDDRATVAVSYRETALLRALLWRFRQFRQEVVGSERPLIWKPALAFMLLALSVGTPAYLLLNRGAESTGNMAGGAMPTPLVSPTTVAVAEVSPQPTPIAAPTAVPEPPQAAPTRSFSQNVIVMDIRPQPDEGLRDSAMRGENPLAGGMLDTKKVYLQISGAQREQVRRQLLNRLPLDHKFSLTDDEDEADIALKVDVASARQGRIALTAYFTNVDGEVIWPLTPGVIARKYEGPLEKVVEAFSRELAGDIQRLERQK
jgi:hypothetical protein